MPAPVWSLPAPRLGVVGHHNVRPDSLHVLGPSLSLARRSPLCPQQRVRRPWLAHARLLSCPSTKTSYSCGSAFAYKRPCAPSKSAFPRAGSWKFSPLQCMVMCLCALLACRSFLLHPNDSRTGLKGYEEYPLRGLGNIGTALPRQPTDSVLRFAEKDNDPYPGFQGSFRVSFRQDFGEYGVPRCSPWGWGERVLTCVVFLLCYFSCLPVLSSVGHLLLLLTCVSALPVASHWTYLIRQGKQRGLIRRCGPPEGMADLHPRPVRPLDCVSCWRSFGPWSGGHLFHPECGFPLQTAALTGLSSLFAPGLCLYGDMPHIWATAFFPVTSEKGWKFFGLIVHGPTSY